MDAELFYDRLAHAYGHTLISPLALALTLVMGLALLLLERRYAVIPFLIVTLFVTEAQRIVVASLDFNMIRIMVLFGWLRVLLRGEHRSLRLHRLDGLATAFALWSVVAYGLLWHTSSAVIYKLGFAFNIIGMYFLFRVLIRDEGDLRRILTALAVLSLPFMLSMLNEQLTHRNLFSVFGGVPEVTLMREGKLRAQASFAHPILAGTFGAVLFPLFVGLYRQGRSYRLLSVAASASSLVIVLASSSSGPVMALLAGILGLLLWTMRDNFRAVQLSGIALLLLLQLFMNAPIYALLARIDVVGGSTGYHRYILIDQFVRNFQEWALVGTKSTAHWSYGLFDLTNQYVAVGVDGGLAALILFVALIGKSFGRLGRVVLAPRTEEPQRFLLWGLACSLLAHCASFLGVAYFDQIIVIWYLGLAMVGSLEPLAAARPATSPAAAAALEGRA